MIQHRNFTKFIQDIDLRIRNYTFIAQKFLNSNFILETGVLEKLFAKAFRSTFRAFHVSRFVAGISLNFAVSAEDFLINFHSSQQLPSRVKTSHGKIITFSYHLLNHPFVNPWNTLTKGEKLREKKFRGEKITIFLQFHTSISP